MSNDDSVSKSNLDHILKSAAISFKLFEIQIFHVVLHLTKFRFNITAVVSCFNSQLVVDQFEMIVVISLQYFSAIFILFSVSLDISSLFVFYCLQHRKSVGNSDLNLWLARCDIKAEKIIRTIHFFYELFVHQQICDFCHVVVTNLGKI